MDRGSPDRTHVFVFDDVVVKINQQDGSNRIARERNALMLLRGASSLRVPEHIADGTSAQGREWLVMTRLAGDVPTDADDPPERVSNTLGFELGTVTAELHNGPRPPGFGTWTEADHTLQEEFRARVESLHGLGVGYEIVERAELDRVAALLISQIGALEQAPREPVLAHRDVQPRNVLVDGFGRVTALLDFESSGGGDPAEDFKCVGLDWHRPGFGAFVRGYRDGGGLIDDGFAQRVAVYVGHWALAALAYLGGFLPHFIPVARQAVARLERGELPQL
ncbi:MAG TPA: aminoglycoside phosphotransferase family protein [Acidimicrobiales bacterium]|nr:aminoglycoside phosphotransferase family protein [Acidimicrobiales bacterium]